MIVKLLNTSSTLSHSIMTNFPLNDSLGKLLRGSSRQQTEIARCVQANAEDPHWDTDLRDLLRDLALRAEVMVSVYSLE